ncbi:hypothetical protein GIB67_042643 [Kingdonia uniflora]|uniref:Uncharacterized protein n=2 Tax=Magnoliopsida TaxID=3398 RepID=A0A7J7P2G6_9MAGN|nr:hypothetical protein GIB67_042643 [Kingdonia uniflora]
MKVQLDPLNADIIGLEKKSAAAYAESLDIEEASLRQASKIDCLLLEIRLVPTFTWWSEGERADIALEVYAVSIVGPFPTAVTNLLDLTRLDLHNNKLTGPIPPQIGRLRRLKILLQEHEKFAGEEDAQDSCARVCSHGWRVDYKSLKIKFRPKPTLELDPDVVAGRGVLTGKVAEDTNPLEIDAEIEPVQKRGINGVLLGNEDYDANFGQVCDRRLAGSFTRFQGGPKVDALIGTEVGSRRADGQDAGFQREDKPVREREEEAHPFAVKQLLKQVLDKHVINLSKAQIQTVIRNLRWNKLQDVIPPEIGELKRLTHLYLSFNSFKGEIPKELANLPELRYLYLHENRFIGRVPAELGNLPNLRHLDVGNNHLVGTIRELIRLEGSFTTLRNLYLNNNYLTGGVPAQLANLTNLEILYLSYNKMSGTIPSGLAHIPRLTYLYLDHNQFSGRIPDTFYKHPLLKEMYIDGNGFRPGVNSVGSHKVLELSDAEFLF